MKNSCNKDFTICNLVEHKLLNFQSSDLISHNNWLWIYKMIQSFMIGINWFTSDIFLKIQKTEAPESTDTDRCWERDWHIRDRDLCEPPSHADIIIISCSRCSCAPSTPRWPSILLPSSISRISTSHAHLLTPITSADVTHPRRKFPIFTSFESHGGETSYLCRFLFKRCAFNLNLFLKIISRWKMFKI